MQGGIKEEGVMDGWMDGSRTGCQAITSVIVTCK